ncbi:hypothetical protein BDL97_02G042200 [Sphagnum fallax]|nr:hypothetical protein BDL97_02G042200 [Sphagnum fallax]
MIRPLIEYWRDQNFWSTLSGSLLTLLFMWVAYTAVGMVDKFVVTPMRMKRVMNSQGFKGPPVNWLLGNMPDRLRLESAESEKIMNTGDYDIMPHVLPFYTRSCEAYGKTHFWWLGWEARIVITELDLVKEIFANKNGSYEKSQIQLRFQSQLLGKGLVTTNGEEWVTHRQTVAPAFHHEKIKVMVAAMAKSASSMADEWETKVMDGGGCVELEVGDYMTRLAANIIAHTAFGSNYERGRKVFDQQLALIDLYGQRAMQPLVAIPGYRTFFFAGHGASSTFLTWTMMLLASHMNWQELAREEIKQVCGHGDCLLDANMLNKLKIVNMILNETLRLFPPFVALTRQAMKDVKLGVWDIPKGLSLHIPILAIHHDPNIWGPDVHEFKPERFANGVAKANKHPLAFMPFSFGQRFCVGQGFTLVEAKCVLVVVLQRFRFHLSPNYRHAPHHNITLKAKYGVPVMLECLSMPNQSQG